MNAVALLKADHRAILDLLEKLNELEGRSRDRMKKALVEKLVHDVSMHAAIEEEFFYPAVKSGISGTGPQVMKCLEEHSVIKWELAAIAAMDMSDERFAAKVAVVKDALVHHIEEEEEELFPRVREAFGVAKLNAMGRALERARKTAPTRPHPRAPNQPPANLVANLGASVIDRARDAGRAMLRKAEKRTATPAARRTSPAQRRDATTKRPAAHAPARRARGGLQARPAR
jgi:hemerythrin superfamily protein